MSMAEALRFEREGYVRRGLTDRVAQVDEQLARLEAEAEPEQEVDEQLARPEAEEPPIEEAVAGDGDVEHAVGRGKRSRKW